MPTPTVAERNSPRDWILVVWIVADLLWGTLVFGTIGYAVFSRGEPGWWFIMAYIFCASPNLFKVRQ